MTEPNPTPAEQAVERAIELLVYAPVGLALTVREELPKLVDKGRQQVTGQVSMARILGQFAVSMGQKEVERRLKQVGASLSALGIAGLGVAPSGGRPAQPPPRHAPVPDDDASAGNGKPAPPRPTAALAIPGYDSLSASQVVQRLAGLSSEELEAVRSYEAATRGRRTILSKISQLQAGLGR